MKTQLNMVRAQVAKRPQQEEINKQIEKAKKIYATGIGRCFSPEIYTR